MKKLIYLLGILCLILLKTFTLEAQTTKSIITGEVLDSNGDPIPFATVAILNSKLGTTTDLDGHFSLISDRLKSIPLIIRSIGYKEQTQKISLNTTPENIKIILEESNTSITEIVIEQKSQTTQLREVPFTISAIDAKPLKGQNLDINQVLNNTTGIRIREEGGLGSNFNFSLTGFSGNQIKFFLDGIPMDNYGSSLTLNNIPINLVTGIEVYKGVVPIHLGSDALGGAVNITTDNSIKNFLDASYSVGSFNTHRAAVVSRYTNEKTGLIFNTNAFYNYSDNNYTMMLSVADPETGKYGELEEIERFHDAYESKTAQLEIGVENKKYADKLFIGLIASGNYKELQTGQNMNKVIGEAFNKDKVFIPSIKYSKNDLFTEGLSLRAFANYNMREALNADTSSYTYDWYGNKTLNDVNSSNGEISWYKTLFSFNEKSAFATANINYKINSVHSFSINNAYSNFERVGTDPISPTVVPFSEPNTISKNILGLSYNLKLLNGKLNNIAFVKKYNMHSVGFEGDRYNKVDSTLTEIIADHSKMGYGLASTYFITNGTQLKVSYEKTYRLPEPEEMFGNGLALLSNLDILPEESQNFNIGILSNKHFNHHNFLAELGYLYRLPKNMIRYEIDGNNGYYENLVSVKGYSLEGGIKYNYLQKINIEVNGTYQKMVHNNKLTAEGGTNYLYNQQLANMPYLFGNVLLGYQFKDFIRNGNNLSINWTTLFVESFYLKSPANGEPTNKEDIPRQISSSLNIAYSMFNGRYNISAACNNITNNELYDNWKLPKPGRAFNIKLRYYISK